MVAVRYAVAPAPRNARRRETLLPPCRSLQEDSPAGPLGCPERPAPVALLSRLMPAFREGRATVDALVRAIPDHPRPLSAVMTLVDAGLLEMDMAGAFGADTRVRLVGPRPA